MIAPIYNTALFIKPNTNGDQQLASKTFEFATNSGAASAYSYWAVADLMIENSQKMAFLTSLRLGGVVFTLFGSEI